MKKNLIVIIIILIVILLAGVLILIRNADQSTQSVIPKSQTEATIANNWKTFFNASTPLQARLNLLQDGAKFNQTLNTELKSIGTTSSSATINSIKINDANTAKVVYTLNLNGQPVLSNQTGQAVLVNNNWVISTNTVCQLLGLQGNKPQTCTN